MLFKSPAHIAERGFQGLTCGAIKEPSKACWCEGEYFISILRSSVLGPELGTDTVFPAINDFPRVFMRVREGKFVFIEMEPAGRSKAGQGTSEFEFITNPVGHFPFIVTVMPF